MLKAMPIEDVKPGTTFLDHDGFTFEAVSAPDKGKWFDVLTTDVYVELPQYRGVHPQFPPIVFHSWLRGEKVFVEAYNPKLPLKVQAEARLEQMKRFRAEKLRQFEAKVAAAHRSLNR